MSFAIVLLALGANPYVNQAKVFAGDQQWEKCLDRLELAQQRTKNEPADEAELELYVGLCRLGLGHELDAREHFAAALKLDPEVKLPATVSSRVRAFFEHVRAHPEEAVVLAPEPPKVEAPKEAVVEPPSVSAQTTRRHLVVPIVLASGAVVSTVVAAVFGAQAKSLESRANAATFEMDIYSLGNSARSNATAANVFFGVAVAALIAAVVVYFIQ